MIVEIRPKPNKKRRLKSMDNTKLVIIAKFSKFGNLNRLFKLSPDQIEVHKRKGWLVKDYVNNYRPGFYTTKKEFLTAKGHNY